MKGRFDLHNPFWNLTGNSFFYLISDDSMEMYRPSSCLPPELYYTFQISIDSAQHPQTLKTWKRLKDGIQDLFKPRKLSVAAYNPRSFFTTV